MIKDLTDGFKKVPELSDICNSYTTGTSALPDIYARVRGQVQECPWYN